MALAVASTSTASANNSASIVVTKPSGVAAGDLLVIVAVAEHDGTNGLGNSTITCTGFTESVQVAREGDNVNTDLNVQGILLYRIADSSDVSASNYTVASNTGSETMGAVAMLRITGWTTGNPVLYKNESNSSLTISSISLTRPAPTLMIMFVARKNDNEGFSFASYSVTSGESNPTWTEVLDANVVVNATADSRRISAGVAYANTSNTSSVTAYSATPTDLNVGSNGTDADISFLAILVEPTNVTTNISPLAVTPTLFAPTVSQVNVNPDVSHLSVTPNFSGLEASSSSDGTRWTPISKS